MILCVTKFGPLRTASFLDLGLFRPYVLLCSGDLSGRNTAAVIPNVAFLSRSTLAEHVWRPETLGHGSNLAQYSSADSLLTAHWVQAPALPSRWGPCSVPPCHGSVAWAVLTLRFLPPQFWQGALPGQAGTSHE